LVKKITGIKKFTDISIGLKNTVKWYIKNEKAKKLKFFFLERSSINELVDMKKIYLLTQRKNLTPQVEKFLFNVMNIKIFLDKHNL
jgi:hypothetical protein